MKRTWLLKWAIFCFLAALILLAGPLSEPRAQSSSILPGAPGSFSELVKKTKPSVVNIRTVKVVKGPQRSPHPFGQDDPLKDFFEKYFRDHMPKEFKQRSLGSGFIIDKEGHILTNNHPLTPLSLGDSEKLEVGDWVIAIGNPFGLGSTVTSGIVSAKYRKIGAGAYDNFIQTDASINPGNSGGPLLNTAGEVVGINSAIFSGTGGSIGIGFAIPINMVKDLLPQLKKGKVVRGWLGVMIQQINKELKEKLGLKDEKGALVADVMDGGPAEEAGIKRGDVIISFDGKEIKEMSELPYIVASTPVGKKVIVELIRKGRKKEFEVEVGEIKEEKGAPAALEVKPKLGMTVKEIAPELARKLDLSEDKGVVVVRVDANSPAKDAGIRPGDIILEVDQEEIKDLEAYEEKIEDYKTGDTILFLINRKGTTLYVTLKMEE
ncbi:MAG: PDZ domain-containing protein [Deltaproteobacteria bacterium]|nr:PDZ domain-containing protein [Deltaproteobacteria bacterium]